MDRRRMCRKERQEEWEVTIRRYKNIQSGEFSSLPCVFWGKGAGCGNVWWLKARQPVRARRKRRNWRTKRTACCG
ncbi:hypothetical protein AMELA_G00238170 [Ameiurus melas]|uniref:Uncharacterized protein n=1 Tax=Ameiurus melas TaxID=219545 RepID=A0A7J5ZV86_AMEME|nr:hypothetical protein AMELA_G00238170 [Ameiurus melas]